MQQDINEQQQATLRALAHEVDISRATTPGTELRRLAVRFNRGSYRDLSRWQYSQAVDDLTRRLLDR